MRKKRASKKRRASMRYKPPFNGDRELRRIMKEFIRRAAAEKGLTAKDYEERIRRDGTYSTMRRFCHKVLFLVEKVSKELLAQQPKRRALRQAQGVLSASKDAA